MYTSEHLMQSITRRESDQEGMLEASRDQSETASPRLQQICGLGSQQRSSTKVSAAPIATHVLDRCRVWTRLTTKTLLRWQRSTNDFGINTRNRVHDSVHFNNYLKTERTCRTRKEKRTLFNETTYLLQKRSSLTDMKQRKLQTCFPPASQNPAKRGHPKITRRCQMYVKKDRDLLEIHEHRCPEMAAKRSPAFL